MVRKCIVNGCIALFFISVAPVAGQETSPEAIVNALFSAGGNHKGVRGTGAKGTCVKGTFSPSAAASTLSKAPHFMRTVPVTARFSMGGSNPNVSDKAKPVTRGFALRFGDPAGDLVLLLISAPMFSFKNPAQLLEGVTARLPGSNGTPVGERIQAFVAANPETTRQAAWLNARPVPTSFATAEYWAVHAYSLVDHAGRSKVVKFKAVPAAGQLGFKDEELATKPDNFYIEELKGRLTAQEVRFDLLAILAEGGDPTDDLTASWPEAERTTVNLGLISISGAETEATCDATTFDPVTGVPEGVSAPTDPMFEIRSPAYAISLSRRAQ